MPGGRGFILYYYGFTWLPTPNVFCPSEMKSYKSPMPHVFLGR